MNGRLVHKICVCWLLAICTFLSCKKSEEKKKEDIVTGRWIETYHIYDSSNDGIMDANEKMAISEAKAIVYRFNKDGTGTYTNPDLFLNNNPIRWGITDDGKNLSIAHAITDTTFSDTVKSPIVTLGEGNITIVDYLYISPLQWTMFERQM